MLGEKIPKNLRITILSSLFIQILVIESKFHHVKMWINLEKHLLLSKQRKAIETVFSSLENQVVRILTHIQFRDLRVNLKAYSSLIVFF